MNKITFKMKNFIKPLTIVGALCFTIGAFAQDETEFVPKVKNVTTPACVLYAKDYEGPSSTHTSPEVLNRMASGTACTNFIVNYTGFTGPEGAQAMAAFQFAVDIWANSIESSQPIRINASFEPLGPGVLGQAGPTTVLTSNHPDATPNVFYPVALWEKIEDQDSSGFGSIDINATFSSSFNWYYGTDAMPPGSQFDFVTVVLHELGHGLGFISFATTDGSTGRLREPSNMIPTVYDLNVENGMGQSLLDSGLFTDPSNDMHLQLTGSNLFNNSPTSVGQNGGVIPRMFAPSPWDQGSSYSHWDESTFPNGNVNSLMTPQIGSGVANHNPGPISLGLFEDMGWSICGGSLTVDEFTVDTVEISPNPFTSSIAIKLSNGANDDYTVNLFDINGRVVMSESLTATNGNLLLSNLDTLGDALYFVKITNDFSGSSITKKVIKN